MAKDNVQNFTNFFKTCRRNWNQRIGVLVRGTHGIGKSEGIYQAAVEYGNKAIGSPLPVVEMRASQMTEGDLMGLPSRSAVKVGDMEVTAYDPPAWFAKACSEPVCLFFDEMDRAVLEVRQGLFQLADSANIAGKFLHPDTVLAAAVNGGSGAAYQTNELDPAELDRWTVVDLHPSVDEWLQWGKDSGKVHSHILSFIQQQPKHLEHRGDFEPHKVYPSRRSWVRASAILCDDCDGEAILDNPYDTSNVFDAEMFVRGIIGGEATTGFGAYLRTLKKSLKLEEIVGMTSKSRQSILRRLKKFDLNDHVALVEQAEHAGLFGEKLDAAAAKNIADWWVRMPAESAMKLYTVLSEGKDKDGKKQSAVVPHNLQALWTCKVKVDGKTVTVQDFVTSLLAQKV